MLCLTLWRYREWSREIAADMDFKSLKERVKEERDMNREQWMSFMAERCKVE